MHNNLIVFDLDGVILESLEAKTDAFSELYNEYGKNIVSKVRNYHLQNGGVSRFKKIEFFHKNYLNKNLSNDELNKLSNKFAKIVYTKVIKSHFVRGFYNFINSINNSSYICLSTGTPTSEAEKILKEKKIIKFFSEIYGSPSEKKSHLQKILNGREFNKKLFFGDASSDYEAAIEYNFKFILREHQYNQNMKKLSNIYSTFTNYDNLNKSILDEIFQAKN